MKLFFFLILFSPVVISQTYWQQEVNYKIDVSLNDKNHTLTANEEFEYINNSPNSLDRIYVHIWPNAYKDKTTALAKQSYKDGDQQLRYITEEKKGLIDSLDFKINGEKVKWEYHAHHSDIAILTLNSPLQPGAKMMVSTPFFVKIPSGSISRLGHIGESYQITQWFPKPAVYDKDGWHYMPYLGQGEFYSEFGSFDVSITLPENYVVGATGDLQTNSEKIFLDKIADETADAIANKRLTRDLGKELNSTGYPISSTETKTIRYTQSNVHDFAWFADKRFSVLKSEVELPHSKRKVTSWAMYTPREAKLWVKASEYINDAVYYYSLWNGDYPYNNVTAVDGTISAGGGMEYPNVTVIGRSGNAHTLEVVIVHEVGHNWFYGQLGTNERVHGWMDEGMNTLNEIRYIQTKYPNNTALSDVVLNGKFHLNDLNHHDLADISYRGIAGIGEDQPIETHSVEFSPINYGIIMYQKTGLVFYYLKDYLGEELFDKCMRNYYREWEFKHPQPIDMQNSLEKTSGKDLNWLFKDLIQTTKHVDYKIKKVKRTENGFDVTIKNVGQVDGPIEVNAIKDQKIVESIWVEPGSKKTIVEMTHSDADKMIIDANKDIPEIHRQNNSSKTKGIFKKYEPLKMEFLFGDNEDAYTNLFWTPTISGNLYDRVMLGLAFHNFSAPTSRFNFLIAPSYSFGRQSISGISELSYTFLPTTKLKTSKFGLSLKSFKNDSVYRNNDSYFISVAPYWQAKIGNRKSNSPISQFLRIQGIYKKDKLGPTHIEHVGFYLLYNYDYRKTDFQFNFQLKNEYYTNVNSTDEVARLFVESTFKYRFMKKKMVRWLELRMFAGQQYKRKFSFGNTYQYSMSLSGADGRQDLFVDDYYFGRNETSGIWSQQRTENMGGFKSTSTLGTSSIAIAAGNLYVPLPIQKMGFLGVFADFGAFNDGIQIRTLANTGVGLRLGGVFGIYFPIWVSDDIVNSYSSQNYTERIRFTLKFNPFNRPLNIQSLF